jgi:hypothetical protein
VVVSSKLISVVYVSPKEMLGSSIIRIGCVYHAIGNLSKVCRALCVYIGRPCFTGHMVKTADVLAIEHHAFSFAGHKSIRRQRVCGICSKVTAQSGIKVRQGNSPAIVG